MAAAPADERPGQTGPPAHFTLPSGVLAEALREVLDHRGTVEICNGTDFVAVPPELRVFLVAALTAAAEGQPVSLVIGGARREHELTSQQVADLLNVSRPYVTGLAKAGRLPHRKVGNRHRFLLSDVIAYKALEDARRQSILQEMAASGGEYVDADFSSSG